MTKRQAEILKIIIKEYAQNGLPVGSKELVKKYKLPFSSATLRNEMVVLEEDNFLQKAHVSSGRIPTDEGYRYFIDNLVERKDTSVEYQKKLELELLKMKTQNIQLERSVGKMLSSMSKCLVISGAITQGEYQNFGIHNLLEGPEFTNLDDFSKITTVLDTIDEKIDQVLKRAEKGEIKIFIGKENPVKEIQNSSMIVSRYEDQKGQDKVIALIGPRSMKYQKNKKLIEFAKRLLRSGGTKKIILFMVGGDVIFRFF
jgi:transcriptional regulator of heat shock response